MLWTWHFFFINLKKFSNLWSHKKNDYNIFLPSIVIVVHNHIELQYNIFIDTIKVQLMISSYIGNFSKELPIELTRNITFYFSPSLIS